MDDIRQAVARIDENVKLLREDFAPLVTSVQNQEKQIAILQNNEKWRKGILSGFFGLFGVIIGALAEFFRK